MERHGGSLGGPGRRALSGEEEPLSHLVSTSCRGCPVFWGNLLALGGRIHVGLAEVWTLAEEERIRRLRPPGPASSTLASGCCAEGGQQQAWGVRVPPAPQFWFSRGRQNVLGKDTAEGEERGNHMGHLFSPQPCQPPSPERHARPGRAEAGAIGGQAGGLCLLGVLARKASSMQSELLSRAPDELQDCCEARGSGTTSQRSRPALASLPASPRRGLWHPTQLGSEPWPGEEGGIQRLLTTTRARQGAQSPPGRSRPERSVGEERTYHLIVNRGGWRVVVGVQPCRDWPPVSQVIILEEKGGWRGERVWLGLRLPHQLTSKVREYLHPVPEQTPN